MSFKEIQLPIPEKVEGWGMTHHCYSPVFRPTTEAEIQGILQFASTQKIKVLFRGGGCSYGDANINNDGIIIDMTQYNQILSWDQETGLLKAQSGVTIKQLWEFSIEKGYWPPVVSGTMHPTLGGALAMNIHGKNNYAVGTIGEHVLQFTFLTVTGQIFICSREDHSELFYAAIGGFGMLGVILEVTIQMKRIYSGKMIVTPVLTNNLEEMINYFEKEYKTSDYLVGWVDSFATGEALGRGLIHKADHIPKGQDKDFPENTKLSKQNLPNRLFGIIPKSMMWLFLFPFTNNLGMRFVNYVKFTIGKFQKKAYTQGHAEFAFLLDYVPNWKFVYKPGSMIQYQVFVPRQNGFKAINEILILCQKRGIISYLSVFKKHRPDKYLMTYSLDGYSLAMDFPVTEKNKEALWNLAYEMDEIVMNNRGKFYLAKDSTLRPFVAKNTFSEEVIKTFQSLKKRFDPQNILQSDQYKRIFGENSER
jgi:decaprenylphospho-beta-D-ribofuranose 2-oxidase